VQATKSSVFLYSFNILKYVLAREGAKKWVTRNPELKDTRYNNVRFKQGYGTLQGAVRDEYEAKGD
jgi:hypothetical protein